MELFTRKMNKYNASDILGWRYKAPYDFYNNELSDEALQELLDDSYQAVVSADSKLIGFFCTGNSAQVPAGNKFQVYDGNYIDIGLGMRPELTGNGLGLEFCMFILDSIQQKQKNMPLRLTVAAFNKRAITLYEKLGFCKQQEFSTDKCEFIIMIKDK